MAKGDIRFIVECDTKKGTASIKKFDGQLDKLEKTSKKAAGGFKGLWKQTAIGVGLAMGFPALTRSIGRLVGSFVNVASEVENYKIRLETLLGSQEKANDAMVFFEDIASKLPFSLQEVIETGVRISTVSDRFKEWLVPIADVAAAMGMKLPIATMALTRALSAGLGAADMFREYGVTPLIREYARLKYGIDDIVKESIPKQREVMMEAFTDVNFKFAGATEKLKGTWTGMISMLGDAWFKLRKSIMEAGIFEFMEEGLQGVLDWIDDFKAKGGFEDVSLHVSAWAEATGWLIDKHKDLWGALETSGAWIAKQVTGEKEEISTTDKLTEALIRLKKARGLDILALREAGPEIELVNTAIGKTDTTVKYLVQSQKLLLHHWRDAIPEAGERVRDILWWADWQTKHYADNVYVAAQATQVFTQAQLDQIGVLQAWSSALGAGIPGVIAYVKGLIVTKMIEKMVTSGMGFFKMLAILTPTAIALTAFTKMIEKIFIPSYTFTAPLPSAATGAYLTRDTIVQAHRGEGIVPVQTILKETFREVIRERSGDRGIRIFIGNREIRDFFVEEVNNNEDIRIPLRRID